MKIVIKPPRKYIRWAKITVGFLPKLKGKNLYTINLIYLHIHLQIICKSPQKATNSVANPENCMNQGWLVILFTHPIILWNVQ